jgi:hypothetical protein
MSAPRKGYRTCRKCGTNRQTKFFKTARGRVCTPCQRTRTSHASRGVRLAETYGITLDEYDAMLAAQGGGCAICGGKRRTNLDVDHCHKTLLVRGLLCRQCNRRLLTAARDNPDVLRAAITYLEDPPAVHTIGERRTPQ